MKFVDTYNINIGDNNGIFTMGLSTCIFLFIKTTKSIIGWHFGEKNMKGLNMERINCLLNTIKEKDVIIFTFMFRHLLYDYIIKNGVLNFQGCKAEKMI
jgi:hypothetical protein